MSLLSYVLLVATAACCFKTLYALPMEGFGSNKCQCVATTSEVIPTWKFKRIEIMPAGAHCRKAEILITKKNNQVVCINPEAQWINNYILKAMSKKAAK